MSTEICHESDAWTIEYDDEIDAVVHRWKTHVTGERFQEGCENVLAVIEDRNARKLLIDSREITAVKQDDIGWMFADWIPRTIEAGLEASVSVYPESTIAKMNVDKMDGFVDDLPDVRDAHTTTDIEEARDWLAER